MFKYEDEDDHDHEDDDQGLDTWRKAIMFSSMSNEFALSSLRLLVRRRVEHEKRNSESTSDHVYFVYYLNTVGLYRQVKSTLLTNEKHRMHHPRKKS